MWNCLKCGKENESNYNFCFVCGAPTHLASASQLVKSDDINAAFQAFTTAPYKQNGDDSHKEARAESIHSRARNSSHNSPSDLGSRIKQAFSAGNNRLKHLKLSADAEEKLNKLVQAGVFDHQAEAAAFLIDEGIKLQAPLFDIVEQKLSEIEQLHNELHHLVKR